MPLFCWTWNILKSCNALFTSVSEVDEIGTNGGKGKTLKNIPKRRFCHSALLFSNLQTIEFTTFQRLMKSALMGEV